MKADRELDAKIAKFMGWTYIPDSKKRLCWKTPEGWLRYKPPAFSTNMTMAMPVLEKMMIRGDVFIEWWQDDEWFVCDQPVGYRDDAIKTNCDGKETGKPSLPLAICRFALKVMEDENE